MAVTTIDTHEVVKELKAAGFNDDQAEAVTRVVRRAQDVDLSEMATKSDLAVLKSEMATKSDMAVLRSDLTGLRSDLQLGLAMAKSDLAETKTDLLKWVIGMIGLQAMAVIGTVVTLIKLLH